MRSYFKYQVLVSIAEALLSYFRDRLSGQRKRGDALPVQEMPAPLETKE